MSSNIGKTGVESIRIKGKEIQDLPLGMGNEAKAQLPDAIATERLNAINTINAKFPKHRIDYLTSRITECRDNIKRINNLRSQQEEMISDYKGYISMCNHRDKEITKLDMKLLDKELSHEEHETQVKALKKQFPPYDVAAMEQQIVQCREAIKRCENVVEQENDSIEEFSEVHALCKQRDIELAKYGAVAEGS